MKHLDKTLKLLSWFTLNISTKTIVTSAYYTCSLTHCTQSSPGFDAEHGCTHLRYTYTIFIVVWNGRIVSPSLCRNASRYFTYIILRFTYHKCLPWNIHPFLCFISHLFSSASKAILARVLIKLSLFSCDCFPFLMILDMDEAFQKLRA